MFRRFVSKMLRLARPISQTLKYLPLFDPQLDGSIRLGVTDNFFKAFQFEIHGTTRQIKIEHCWNSRTSYIVQDVILNTNFGLIFKNGKIVEDVNPRDGSAQDSAAINRACSTSRRYSSYGQPESPVYFINSLAGNYYHWITEELPKVVFTVENYSNVTFLVGNDFPSFANEILSLLTITPITISEPVIHLNAVILIERCDVGWPHPVDLNRAITLGSKLLESKNLNWNHKLIYISRKKSSRPLEDEYKLENYLASRGFEVLYTEDLDFVEKMRQFSECEILISQFGAGLTNLIFIPSKALIIELANSSYWGPYYQVLSQLTDHRHVTIGLQAAPKSDFGSAAEAIEKISHILDVEFKERSSKQY